jgi:hypothetical protein
VGQCCRLSTDDIVFCEGASVIFPEVPGTLLRVRLFDHAQSSGEISIRTVLLEAE